MASNLTDQLRKFLDKNQIFDNELWREIYARDASYFDLKPECVVRPSSIEQIREVLRIARDAGTSVTFRAGGTSSPGRQSTQE